MTQPRSNEATADALRLEGAGIRRLTLRFVDPAVESRYRREDTLANRTAVRQWSIWGIIVFTAIGIFEWQVMPGHSQVPLIVRYGTCLPIFLLNYTLAFIIDYERYFIRINPISMCAAALTTIFAFSVSPPEFQHLYLSQFLAFELFLFLHPGVSFRIKVIIGWSATVGFLGMAKLTGMLEWSGNTLEEVGLLVAANVMAMFSAYTGELANRRLFRANLVMARQRQLDSELQQKMSMANRLEAVGRLAGGVAHDFNNLLQVIASSAYMVKRKTVGGGLPIDGELAAIATTVRRGSDLTWRLLAFSRQQPTNKSVTDLRRVASEMKQMLDRTVEKNIDLSVDIPAGQKFQVMANPGAMDQILLNLAINGCDAMPDGGHLRIAMAQVPSLPDSAVGATAGGPFVRIDVCDEGQGIPDAIKDKVFDPFFTTKEFGKGSGLGLSIVFGIVKDHDGYVVLSDAIPTGTMASVYIPLHQESEAAAEGADSTTVPLASRSILLAEDETDLAATLSNVLKLASHRVTVAPDGVAAIEAIQRGADAFDIAVLDVAMPKADGVAVYAAIRKVSPNLPVIFSSGFRSRSLDPAIVRDPAVSFLDKPYSPEDLLERIEAMLAPRT